MFTCVFCLKHVCVYKYFIYFNVTCFFSTEAILSYEICCASGKTNNTDACFDVLQFSFWIHIYIYIHIHTIQNNLVWPSWLLTILCVLRHATTCGWWQKSAQRLLRKQRAMLCYGTGSICVWVRTSLVWAGQRWVVISQCALQGWKLDRFLSAISFQKLWMKLARVFVKTFWTCISASPGCVLWFFWCSWLILFFPVYLHIYSVCLSIFIYI